MLFLYFLFAIPAGMVVHDLGPFVDRPAAIHSVSLPGAGRDDAIVIAVMRDGGIYFNEQRVSREELTRKISDRIHLGAPAQIFIQADARCRYLAVKQVLAAVRSAGVERIAFLTSSRKGLGL